MFNCFWDHQEVPVEWKHGIIKLIPKPGAEHHRGDPSFFRPIALTSCVGKLYTNILKDRWTSFLVSNGYWSTSVQKGFLSGVSGCLEHQFVLCEALQNARRRQDSICCCWLDFKNAFGSVGHNLIHFAIDHYHGSPLFANVVRNLYKNVSARVKTKDWTTQSFKYRVGVFQGDPLSVSIFNTVANLLSDCLDTLSNRCHGYQLKPTGDSIVILQFDDDAVLLINSVSSCQFLYHQTDLFPKWFKIDAKVSKCSAMAYHSRPKQNFMILVSSWLGSEYRGLVIVRSLF